MAKTDRKYLTARERVKKEFIMDRRDPTIKDPRNKYLGTDTPYRYQKPRGVNMPDEPSPKKRAFKKRQTCLFFIGTYMNKKTMRDLRMLRMRLRRMLMRLPSQ